MVNDFFSKLKPRNLRSTVIIFLELQIFLLWDICMFLNKDNDYQRFFKSKFNDK